MGYGEKVARQFLDSGETGSEPRSLAALHNSQAGRVAVRKTMKTLCKCHGVSGSTSPTIPQVKPRGCVVANSLCVHFGDSLSADAPLCRKA